jgi:hypothetical protein
MSGYIPNQRAPTHSLILGDLDKSSPWDSPIVPHIYRTSQMELDSMLAHTGRHSDCQCGLPHAYEMHVTPEQDAENHRDCRLPCCAPAERQ